MLAWRQSAFATGRTPISDRKLRLFACACARQVWPLLPCGCDHGNRPPAGEGEPWTPCPDCGGTGWVNRSRRAVEVAERFADGEATSKERGLAFNAAELIESPTHGYLAEGCLRADAAEGARQVSECLAEWVAPALQAALLRDIVGNPFRPALQLCGRHSIADNCPGCRAIRTPTVVSLAQAAYLERLPPAACGRCGGCGRVPWGEGGADLAECLDCRGSGEGPSGMLDPDRLLVLADALEEAGCAEEALLRHLRGWEPCLTCLGGKRPCHTCAGARWIPSTGPPLSGPHVRGCWVLDLLLGKS